MRPLWLGYIDGTNWRLLTPYVYVGERWHGHIPKGFITDFASVPRLFWNVMPPTGVYGPAAIIHDYLYRRALVSRADADWTLREAAQRLGADWITCQTLYYGVRLFGASSYHRPAPKHDASSWTLPSE